MRHSQIPHCQICGELATDNAIGNHGKTFHKCTRTALLRALGRNAEECRNEILHGWEAGAFLRARNAYWYARRAGLLPWAPVASRGGREVLGTCPGFPTILEASF